MKNNPHYNPKFSYHSRLNRKVSQLWWESLHIDPPLLLLLILLAGIGLFILFSASNENSGMVIKQALRLFIAFGVMLTLARIPPKRYYQWAVWIYSMSLLLLMIVLIFGQIDKGARRWLDLGILNFQPSELMTLAVPLIIARYISHTEFPLKITPLIYSGLLVAVPVALTIKQPDLGTSIIIATSGFCALLLAGLSWKLLIGLGSLAAVSSPFLWHCMHQYQKERVLTFLNPERDPLGSGYHIIQSKIAIGSGGLFGKGWLYGTQSHLQFLPARTTDFIFAVNSEEMGFIGCILLLLVLLAIFLRCLYISRQAQDTFTRLLTGTLSLTFIISALINIGMVIGILPVVGVPLPLISYGGSSMVTIMAGFGIIMSIRTHRRLWSS